MGGMVVAPQVLAAEAGAMVLREGGNAIDAAVTSAFAQMIVDPQNAGIAGFGVATVRASNGSIEVIDFNGTAGSRATPDMWKDIVVEQDWTGYGFHIQGHLNDRGYQSIMTPGTVAGMSALLEKYGTISWSRAIQPAIGLAREGFPVYPALWQGWNTPRSSIFGDMLERLRVTEASRKIYFTSDGRTREPGEILRNPDYADTLQRLAEAGPDDFYTGGIARRMSEDLEANGSFVTASDLADYRVRHLAPITTQYRGLDVFTNPPAGGGICVAQILNILEHEDIAALRVNSVEYIDLVARAMQAAYHDWYTYVGDPEFVDVPLGRLVSKEHAADWYRRIHAGESITVPLHRESPHTTNVTVADDAGNVIALTHSLGSASGVVTPGLGFMYNNIMNAADPISGKPNSIAPGKSRITGMCPTIVQNDGKPVLALGAPGGTRIITGVLQALLNVIDHGLRPQEAVDVARFDCQSHILDCEARIPSWTREALRDRGFQVHPNPATYGNFARVQALAIDPETGAMLGGSDPRGGGAVFSG
jgi:gamma-glutamyltranspeptidase / glutathione hydrolase